MNFSRSLASLSALSLLTLVAVACSAPLPPDPTLEGEQNEGATTKAPTKKTPKKETPSPEGEEEEGENQGDGTGTGTGTGTGKGTGTGTNPPPGGANCGAQASYEACIDCCVDVNPAGIKVADDAFIQCACQSPGVCANVCGNNFCTNPDTASPQCDDCLAQATQCQQAASSACNGNPGCMAVTSCFQQSQCEAKP